MISTNYVPPVGFYFQLKIGHETISFQEVSGISVVMDVEEIAEGGDNRFVHRVPGRTTSKDLVLKRGLVSQSSAIALWIREKLQPDLSKTIHPTKIEVALKDQEGNRLMVWQFIDAYPIAWDVSSLEDSTSHILIESLRFSYNYFERTTIPPKDNR